MAKPTAFEIPWPSGPVVTSIPEAHISLNICVITQGPMLLTVGMVGLGVPRSQRVNLAECLEIIYRELIAQKMKDDVLKSAATAGRLDSCRANYQAHLRVTGSEFMRDSNNFTRCG
jgi:hypothetical protein